MTTSAEQDLNEFLARGDLEALASLFERLAPSLLNYARRLMRDDNLAEDLVQDTFLRILDRGAAYDGQRSALRYLAGILRNQARRVLRRERRRSYSLMPADTICEPPPTKRIDDLDTLRRVSALIRRIASPYQEVLVLYIERQMPPAQIAAELDRNVGAVRVQLHRGLQQLRAALPAGCGALLLLGGTGTAGSFRSRPVVAAASLAALTLFGIVMLAMPPSSARGSGFATVAHIEASIAPSPVRRDAPANRTGSEPIRRALLVPAPTLRLTWPDGSGAAAVGAILDPSPGHDPDFVGVSLASDGDGHLMVPADLAGKIVRVSFDRGFERTLTLPAGGETARVELPAGDDFVGLVVTADGAPAAGARIWLGHHRHPWLGQVVCHADANGRFALRGVTSMCTVAAHAEGWASTPTRTTHCLAGESVVLRLGRSPVTLQGRCLDAAGTPLSNAVVVVGDHPRGEHGNGAFIAAGTRPNRRLRTDGRGCFSAPGLAPGPVQVLLRAPGHRAVLASVDLQAPVAQVELRAEPGVPLRGNVLDQSGRPVPNAGVEVLGVSDFDKCAVRTDDGGNFVLQGLNPARRVLSVAAEGMVAQRVAVAPETRLIQVRMMPRVRVTGQLASVPTGSVYQVCLAPDRPQRWHAPAAATTATDGRFELCGEPAARLLVSNNEQPVWIPAVIESDTTSASTRELRVRLPAAWSQRGWLRCHAEDAGPTPCRLVAVVTREHWTYSLVGLRDDDGGWRFGPLPPGRYETAVFDALGRLPPRKTGTVEVEDGRACNLGRISPVAGTLSFALGRKERGLSPLAACVIDRQGFAWPLAGASGKLRLAPGHYRLRASGMRFARVDQPFEIVAGQTSHVDVILQPAPFVSIHCALIPCPTRPPIQARLESTSGAVLHDAALEPDVDGLLRLSMPLAPGHYKLRLALDGKDTEWTVDVGAGVAPHSVIQAIRS